MIKKNLNFKIKVIIYPSFYYFVLFIASDLINMIVSVNICFNVTFVSIRFHQCFFFSYQKFASIEESYWRPTNTKSYFENGLFFKLPSSLIVLTANCLVDLEKKTCLFQAAAIHHLSVEVELVYDGGASHRCCLAAWCAVWSLSVDPAYCSLQLTDYLINCCQIGHTPQRQQRHDTPVWSIISQDIWALRTCLWSGAAPVCSSQPALSAGCKVSLSWDHLSPWNQSPLTRGESCCCDN